MPLIGPLETWEKIESWRWSLPTSGELVRRYTLLKGRGGGGTDSACSLNVNQPVPRRSSPSFSAGLSMRTDGIGITCSAYDTAFAPGRKIDDANVPLGQKVVLDEDEF